MGELAGLGFTRQTPLEIEALKTGAPHPVAGPIAPSTALTVQGPGQQLPPSVMPMPGPQRNVNIEGQSYTLPNQIDTANSQAARGQPVTQPTAQPTMNPKQFSQNLAASKLAQQTPPQIPVAGPVQPQPISPKPQPIVQPTQGTRSSADIRKELDMIGNQSDSLHQKGLEEGIKYGTPEGESHQAQLGQLNARTKVLEKELEDAIKAEKKASKPSKKGPDNVSKMMTPEDTFKALKQDVPRSEMSITEGKIFDMTQAERDAYEIKLHNEMKNAKNIYPDLRVRAVDQDGRTLDMMP